MANTFIPAKDVGRVFLDLAREAMAKNFPKLIRDSEKYNKTLAKVLWYTFRGLYGG